MTTRTRNHPRLAAAVRRALTTACGIAQASPIALGAVLAAASTTFATCAYAANTYFVTTAADPGDNSGTLSLRQAIAAANTTPGNTIEFAPALVGSTITLTNGQIAITQPMTITGPGAGLLTISGNNLSRIFLVAPEPHHSKVTISDVTLTQGNSLTSVVTKGGAIYAVYADFELDRSTITSSKAKSGGALYSFGGDLLLQNSRLSGNNAQVRGGALYSSSDGTVRTSYATIDGNTAAQQGGGIFIENSPSVFIDSSTISGNVVPQPDIDTGPQGGGGIAFAGIPVNGQAEINRSTITQNYAASGGAGLALLDAASGSATETYFCTIAGNSAGPYETGIGITSAGGTVDLYNTIAANNFSQTSSDDLAGSFRSRHSLIQSPGGATITGTGSLIGLNPLLGPLADNGGATLTLLPSTTSPVLHQVPCTFCVDSIKDQRGAQRHNPADIGAVERQYPEQLIFRNGFDPPL